MIELVDTHCHIHEAERSDGTSETRTRWQRQSYLAPAEMIVSAKRVGVTRLICVGTTLADSKVAAEFARARASTWASIGIHPHEAKHHLDALTQKHFSELLSDGLLAEKIVAVGECGLDYFYGHSPKNAQKKLLRFQIELALTHNLPLIFHVREALDDFWPIFDSYSDVCGVIHSFSATRRELDQILTRGLYVGLNGIMTFTKNSEQLAAAKAVPLDKLMVETDAPFLTPDPYRGKICEPKHVRVTAEFLANLRGESLALFARQTTKNARNLFSLD